MRAPHAPLLLILLAGAATADAPEPRFEAVREGLLSPGRGAREGAEKAARELARTDPGGVAALWDRIDLRGRCLLLRALAAAGTRHAAEVALVRAGAPEPELFRALLDGLAAGGEAALFAPLPEEMPAPRKEAIEALRLRWRLEEELSRLKSPSGPTGHYTGQFARVKALGRAVIPILLDITADRARPLPGESAAGPYAYLHPDMARFDAQELRGMTAYAFAEVAEKDDAETIRQLRELHTRYTYEPDSSHRMGFRVRRAEGSPSRFEREDLGPSIAFSLYDLGVPELALEHVRSLEDRVEDDDRLLWELGYACIRIGRFEEGQMWYAQALHREESRAIAAYNLACNFSMRAQRESRDRPKLKRAALEFLEMAILEFNYGDWKWMEEDGDLAFIRGEPKYQELLRHLQQKYPERRKGKVPKGRSAPGPR